MHKAVPNWLQHIHPQQHQHQHDKVCSSIQESVGGNEFALPMWQSAAPAAVMRSIQGTLDHPVRTADHPDRAASPHLLSATECSWAIGPAAGSAAAAAAVDLQFKVPAAPSSASHVRRQPGRLMKPSAQAVQPAGQEPQQEQYLWQDPRNAAAQQTSKDMADAPGDRSVWHQQQGLHEQHELQRRQQQQCLLLDQQWRRVCTIDLACPVIHFLSCQQYCGALLQHPGNSHSTRYNRFQLQLFMLQQQKGKQQLAVQRRQALAVLQPTAAAAGSAVVKNGVILLPQSTRSCGPRAADPGTSNVLIAAVCPLEIAAIDASGAVAAAAGAGAAVGLLINAARTPSPQPPSPSGRADPVKALLQPPLQAAAAVGAKSVKSLHQLTGRGSLSHGKPGKAATSAQQEAVHGVKIYTLSVAADTCCDSSSSSSSVALVQTLATPQPVLCLTCCDMTHLMAAAGEAGFAQVWSLSELQQQQQQQQQWTNGPPAGSRCINDVASSSICLPAAAYRGISFPDITQVCFVVQPEGRGSTAGLGDSP
jgi:hypothetical protein